MDTLAEFLDEPVGRMAGLALAAIVVFVGLHSLGGFPGFGVAALAVIPAAMMVTGGRPLMRVLRALGHRPVDTATSSR